MMSYFDRLIKEVRKFHKKEKPLKMPKILLLQRTKKNGCYLILIIVQMLQKLIQNWSGNKTKQN